MQRSIPIPSEYTVRPLIVEQMTPSMSLPMSTSLSSSLPSSMVDSPSPYLSTSPSPSPCGTPKLHNGFQFGEIAPRSPGLRDFPMRKSQNRRRNTMENGFLSRSPDYCQVDSMTRRTEDALPSEPCNKYPVRKISVQTLKLLLDEGRKDIVIVDCRYPSEFDEGHLLDALNVWNESILLEKFPVEQQMMPSNTILLFHCERSSKRAPELAIKLREEDIRMNGETGLFYNNIFVIDTGMIGIFRDIPYKCTGKFVPTYDASIEAKSKYYRKQASLAKLHCPTQTRMWRTNSVFQLNFETEL